ncbi:MAG: hypothetical protein AAGH17_10515, partial [Pseudomonadota bacterium]
MKGSNSRQIAAKDTEFTNLFHIQGGMVTDSDLCEGAALAQSRDEALGQSTIGTGIPAQGGMVEPGESGLRLKDGTVYAQGKRGEFRLKPEGAEAKTLFDQLPWQADFPGGPSIDPKLSGEPHLIYADLWDRPVLAVQDNRLTDAGLHGTETSYRTRTMVQVKVAPLLDGIPETGSLSALMTHPALVRTGNASLQIGPLTPDEDTNGCDPCADRIIVDRLLPNALWRLEVVAVQRDDDGNVTAFELAWSLENAAAVEANTTTGRQAIKRSEGEAVIYEFFSDATEAYKGWFPQVKEEDEDAAAQIPRASFVATIDGAVVESEGGDAYIRRWDGHLRYNGSIVKGTGASSASLAGKTVVINTGHFTATLNFDKKEMLIGDYWLVELRRFADPKDQLHLVGGQMDGKELIALPCGIEHVHCPIGIYVDDKLIEPDQALAQITAFPTLTTLAAGDVSYNPPEGCVVFEPVDPDTNRKR